MRPTPLLPAVRTTGLAAAVLVAVTLPHLPEAGGAMSSSAAPASAPAAAAPPGPRGDEEWPVTDCGTYSGTGCSPTGARVDLAMPTFTHPTDITNSLFPIARLRSVVQLGEVDGKPFRSEQTLLPGTGVVRWAGRDVEVLLSQYLAYTDGRIEEIALDRYAQADDGSVWYFGEDVYDYVDGAVAVTEGTWLAGRDGPPAMIMPARPKVGDVFRTENVIGVVFEEIRVVAVDQTVPGPRGPVRGAIVAEELHLDGSHSRKTFAPGYGEFRTGAGGDVEALALAVPTDATGTGLPAALRSISTGAWGLLENLRLGDYEAAAPTVARIEAAWATLRRQPQPPLVAQRLTVRLAALAAAVRAGRAGPGAQAAVDVARSALDLELRYRPAGQVDLDRIHHHAQQLRVRAASGDLAGVSGEVASIEWTRERLALPTDIGDHVDADVRALRTAADLRNPAASGDHAARLGAYARTLRGAADGPGPRSS